jgi:hypothetical protein
VRRFGSVVIAAATMAMIGLGYPSTASAANECMHNFGSPQRLTDAGGVVVQECTVTDLKKSTDPVPGYPLAGQLWEATASVKATSGTVTPIIPNFHAVGTDGRNYAAMWQLASPQGISGATIAQGQTSTGKIYFDATGADPAMVTYTSGGAPSLMWCDCDAMMAMPMEEMMTMPMGDCPCCMQG